MLPVLGPSLLWTLALCAGASLAVLIIAVAQVGPLLTAKPLQPKANRLSPLQGEAHLWHARLGALCLVDAQINYYWYFGGVAGARHDATRRALCRQRYHHSAGSRVGYCLARSEINCGAVSPVNSDVVYQKWQHRRDLMMSKQEVKQEMKQSDGDPYSNHECDKSSEKWRKTA